MVGTLIIDWNLRGTAMQFMQTWVHMHYWPKPTSSLSLLHKLVIRNMNTLDLHCRC